MSWWGGTGSRAGKKKRQRVMWKSDLVSCIEGRVLIVDRNV